MKERWTPIPGYVDLYEVSTFGRIRSHHASGCIRIPRLVARYPALELSKDGTKTFFYVHVLVALAFLGPRPNGMWVAHFDGDKENPRLSNLRYATPAENDADKIRHGTRPNGMRNGRSKLTDEIVIEARRRHAAGERTRHLSRSMGIDIGTMSRILTRKRWAHL